jgi:hypothetical protein
MASPEDQLATMLKNIPEKTGRTLAEWITLVEETGLKKHVKIMNFLKKDHGVTHGFANLISAKVRDTGEEVDLVAVQYEGAKAALKPLYDAILAYALSLGDDVEVSPKKTSVSLRRKKQFALITPATKTRIDLGLALKGEDAAGRLESYNAMCSHRVRLQTEADFDDEVKAWMAEAYARCG